MQPGDALILTKPIGTGTLLAADMRGKAKGSWIDGVIQSMLVSNQSAATLTSEALQQHGLTGWFVRFKVDRNRLRGDSRIFRSQPLRLEPDFTLLENKAWVRYTYEISTLTVMLDYHSKYLAMFSISANSILLSAISSSSVPSARRSSALLFPDYTCPIFALAIEPLCPALHDHHPDIRCHHFPPDQNETILQAKVELTAKSLCKIRSQGLAVIGNSTMDVYVFVYHAKPTKGSPEHGVVGGAHVDIWIYDSSRKAAESRAISFLMDLSWEIIEAERDLVIDDEQIALCSAGALENYLQAKERGMSALFFAYPSANTDDDVVEVRSIKKPPISPPTTRH